MATNPLHDMPDPRVADADVLVIGGGFAGAWAALRAAEITSNVVLLEKAYVSRSGASTMSGGVTTCPPPGEDLTPWAQEFAMRGDYMCDQAWTLKLMEGQRSRVAELEGWGVPISRDPDGRIRRFSSRGMVSVRCMQYSPKLAMEALRREAVARGVRIVDRFCVTDLMTSDGAYPTTGSVIGAFGFDVRSGACTAFRARQTIVATGQLSMKGVHHVDNDTGDGVAMAWRVGARLIDLEFTFGGTFSVLMKHLNLGSYNVAVAHGARLINRHGERFMAKVDPVRFERSELSRVVAAFVKEVADGNGPVCIDLRHCDDSYWTDLKGMAMQSGGTALLSDKVPDPRTTPLPIEATWGLWSSGLGGIGIDIDCRTSLPGLYAAGGAAKNPATGTHASAGAPTAFAMNSGYFAGEHSARQAAAMALPDLPATLLERLRDAALSPLQPVDQHRASSDDLHDQLSRVGGSVVEAMSLDDTKLKAMTANVDRILSTANQAYADNLHDLVKIHEARHVCENLKAVYLSALDRTESREQFYRSDFPDTDDANWFCLHGIRRGEGGPVFERLPIPTHDFSIERPQKALMRQSQLAGIFAGNYDPSAYDD